MGVDLLRGMDSRIGYNLKEALGAAPGQTGYLSWRPEELLVVLLHYKWRDRFGEWHDLWHCPICHTEAHEDVIRPEVCSGFMCGRKFHPTLTLEFAALLANVQTEVEA